jgi:hypothetical protein
VASAGATKSKSRFAADHPNWDPLLLIEDASLYLNCHPDTLRRYVRTREITCVRCSRNHGGIIKFRLSELNRWVSCHTIKASRA